MAKDRTLDRHRNPGYLYRPVPADLLERLDAAMGPRQRSRVISRLVADFLAGEPMPTVDGLLGESDKPGQGHGA